MDMDTYRRTGGGGGQMERERGTQRTPGATTLARTMVAVSQGQQMGEMARINMDQNNGVQAYVEGGCVGTHMHPCTQFVQQAWCFATGFLFPL
jgi:urease alpha subunit